MDAVPPPSRRPRIPPPPDAEATLDTLPLVLLDSILSRLSLRDAVRTSLLSRAWRHRWKSVPDLDFTWGVNSGMDPGAITGLLDRYSCSVPTFAHWHITDAAFSHSDAWLRILAHKEVQFLTLFFVRSDEPWPSIHTLHPSIFSCCDLVLLFLHHCNIPATPPGFAGLPKLTNLCLSYVDFIGEGAQDLELLIATSPLFERLHLRDLQVNGDPWVIQAPKLREFGIIEYAEHWWQVNNLPSLEVATIKYYGHQDFINLVTSVAAASQLKLDIPMVAHGNILEGLSRSFDNLNNLSLHVCLCIQSSVLPIISLLRNALKLESLCLELYDELESLDEVDSEFLDAQWSEDLFSNLTSVDMKNLLCKSSEMHFIEFLLSKARRLEELNVCLAKECPRSNEEVVIELLEFRIASPRAVVFFERIRD